MIVTVLTTHALEQQPSIVHKRLASTVLTCYDIQAVTSPQDKCICVYNRLQIPLCLLNCCHKLLACVQWESGTPAAQRATQEEDDKEPSREHQVW